MTSTCKLLVLLCLCVLASEASQKRIIKIGAIFLASDQQSIISFHSAVHRENVHSRRFELHPIVRNVTEWDSFVTEKIVCSMVAEGVAAIFGPNSITAAGIASSICNALKIPHIITHWSPQPMEGEKEAFSTVVNVYPDSNELARALADLLKDYSWKSFTILYDTDEALMRLKDVLQLHGPQDSPITVRQLGEDPDYRPLLKEISSSGENNIVLECEPDKILDVLRQAKEVKMLEEYQSYVITSLNTHTVDFSQLEPFTSNITSIRMMDPEGYELRTAVHDWMDAMRRYNREAIQILPEHVRTESAIVHDAVKLFATVLREMPEEMEVLTERLSCQDEREWQYGQIITDAIKIRKEYGITGPIIFNDELKRTHFTLDIIELFKANQQFKKIGIWDPNNGINYTRTQTEVQQERELLLQNKHFIVASRLGKPFLHEVEAGNDSVTLEGNARYAGYSKDLIDLIAKDLNIKYRIEIVPDGKYGSLNKETKKWDGLVKHLLDRKADLAICDLTITYERRTAVDFTMPFMTLGVSILYAKPIKQPPNLFAFLSPLSLDVWIYMATAYLGVSILLFVLARMAPDDWENPHPCNQNPEEVENIWHLLNCTWLTMGSIMGQGSDILPKAVSTRLVTGMWWFFALIMLSSYTANLAAFLTMERMDVTIGSAEDLAKQSKIKYGAVLGGSTMQFFKESNFSTYQRMWAAMESARPSVFTKSNDEGVDRVKKGKRLYAFLMESTPLEYITERHCELTQIGGLLDTKGYGIAMPVNSPYRTQISGVVLKMQEDGRLHHLKTRWWKDNQCIREKSSDSDSAAELGVDNVGGVFVVLASGCTVALIIGVLEFLWNVRKVAVDERITPWEALKAELNFSLKIWVTTKPVHNRISESSASSKRSSKSRAVSESRSAATNALHGTSSIMQLDKDSNYSTTRH